MYLVKQFDKDSGKFAQSICIGKWPFINKCNKIKHLQFTKIYVEMPIDFWGKILTKIHLSRILFRWKTRFGAWKNCGAISRASLVADRKRCGR
jgi:hypothetical protein